MDFSLSAADSQDLRLAQEGREKTRDSWFFLFWPLLGLRYVLIERFIIPERYYEVHCALDDVIPFLEWFVIPYGLWYVFIAGMHLYTYFFDKQAFQRYSRFLITAFSISTLTFLLFPTCQNLRPTEFPRDNIFTDIVRLLYRMDTNTNVCPSEHVIGSIAAFLAVLDTKRLRKPGWIALFGVVALFTSIATVFLKQHSFVDVIAALPVCLAAYLLCCRRERKPIGQLEQRGLRKKRFL